VVVGTTMTFASVLPAWAHYAVRGGLLVLLGGLWLTARGDGAFGKLRPIFFAYFAVTFGLTLAYYAGGPMLAALHHNAGTAMDSALQKFVQAALIVISVVALTILTGQSLGSLHIRKGRLLLGLSLGLLGMAVFIGLTFVPGGPFLKTVNTAEGMSKLMAVLPWVALFVLSNAFMEELLFRGVLLERYEALTGKWLALFSTTLVFALAHVQVTYAANLWQFVIMVFGLGLMWGFLMQRSKSIWGSVLFHAGADVAIILPIYQSMGS
jgi:membrane protease YdiL (CAAX protease family)